MTTREIQGRRRHAAELLRRLRDAETRTLMLARSEPIGSETVRGAFIRTTKLYEEWFAAETTIAEVEGMVAQIREDREKGLTT